MIEENRDEWKIPLLNNENHDSCFRKYRVKLISKGVYYVIQKALVHINNVVNMDNLVDRLGQMNIFDEKKRSK